MPNQFTVMKRRFFIAIYNEKWIFITEFPKKSIAIILFIYYNYTIVNKKVICLWK